MSGNICIRRTHFGGREDQSFDDFVDSTIQDTETALDIATSMLADWDALQHAKGFVPNYRYGADDRPEYYEEFEILDADELRRAAKALREEFS